MHRATLWRVTCQTCGGVVEGGAISGVDGNAVKEVVEHLAMGWVTDRTATASPPGCVLPVLLGKLRQIFDAMSRTDSCRHEAGEAGFAGRERRWSDYCLLDWRGRHVETI